MAGHLEASLQEDLEEIRHKVVEMGRKIVEFRATVATDAIKKALGK
jgi:hypothetical protein